MTKKPPVVGKVCPSILAVPILIFLIWGEFTPLWASSLEENPFPSIAINGWRQSGGIQTFSPRKLYDYIDGAADLYLTYDFQELKVTEYLNEKKASVTVEIYRHGTPFHAFGIYSQERLGNANFLDVGAQGYSEKNILNFVSGNYYVKINSFHTGSEDEKVLLAFAKEVADHLGGKGALPLILSAFPEEGKKKNSEKFIAQDFLGYSFLHSAFTADYELPGKKFKLYVIEGADREDCGSMIRKYLQQTGDQRKNVAEGRYTLPDPYHGEMDLVWKGRYIWGVLNLGEPSLRSKYLKLFEEGLQKKG
jgi:hypothetical protein